MKARVRAIVFVALLQAFPAHAERGGLEQLLSLSVEDVMAVKVKISTHTEKTLSKAPSVVSVITADDIKDTGAANLTEILQTVPGIYVRNNLFGFRPHVTFRGAATTHTLIMVNGVPMKDLVWSSGIFWKGLATNMIERVEIIRGPGSAQFGSDASAGVINIITKTAGRIGQSEAGVRAGSFDAHAGWLQHGGEWNGFDVAFTAELSHTDGHDPFIASDGQTTKDRIFGTRVSYAPGYAGYGYDNEDLRFSMGKGNWRLLAEHLHRSNVGIGLTGGGVLDPLTRASDSRFDLALLYDNETFAQDWGMSSELRYHHLDYTSGDGFQENPPGFRDAGGTYPDGFVNQMRAAQRGVVLEASGLYSGLKTHAIRLGGGYREEDLYFVQQRINKGTGPDGNLLAAGGPLVDVSDSRYAFAPEKTRRIRYVFIQDAWAFSPDWELTAGARYDHYSDFGGTLNPRLALVWQTSGRLTTKLMAGQAFRAPSYQELYALTAVAKPNPDLMPERSKTWDLLFSFAASKNLELSLDLYRFKQFDLIAFDSSNQFRNIGNNTALGVEMEAQWQAAKTLRVAGNLTSRHDSAAFNSVPRRKAYLRTDWAFLPGWNWNVQINWMGRRALLPGDPRSPLEAYALTDTTLRYAPGKRWEYAASIRNLFDVDAREYSSASIPGNLPLPGRGFHADVRYKF
jgi:iron complex outermembrane receptor protein